MNFTNKVVWITGASSGIGKHLAIELSNQNAKLIVSSRNTEALETVKSLCKDSENVKIVPLDLEDYNNLSSKVENAISSFGTVDILVNNGGISQRAFAKDTIIAVDKRLMDINYIGTVALTKLMLPHFINKKSGHIVVTTSNQNNIAVTLVCPGFVNTNVSLNALTGDGTAQQTMDKATKNGIAPDYFAKLMTKAILKKRQEVYIGGFKEKLAVYAKRFFPKILSKMIRKLSVT